MTTEQLSCHLAGREPTLMGARNQYAVMVPLVEGAEGSSLLFEVRAATLRRQPNEICFPGGRREGAESLETCALRETQEELGLPPSALSVLAPLDYMAYQSGFVLHPFLGHIDPEALKEAAPNPDEVGEIFQVPLDFFLNTDPEIYHYDLVPKAEGFPYQRVGIPENYPWRGGRTDVPVYHWQGRIIWGMTARIIWGLVEILRRECGS